MKVKYLHLQNYGRFEDLKIDFAPTAEKAGNVTVIVGNNGAGKSQILQALATSLSWFVGYLRNGRTSGFSIDEHSIKNNKNDVSAEITTDFGHHNYTSLFNEDGYTRWQLSSVREGRNNVFEEKLFELESVVQKYRNILTHRNSYSLPLLVFYPVERSSYEDNHRAMLSKHSEQFKGYFECLDGAKIDFSDFINWFREREDIENEVFRRHVKYDKKEIKQIHKSMDQFEKEISKLNEEFKNFLDQKNTIDKNTKDYFTKKLEGVSTNINKVIFHDDSNEININLVQDNVLSVTKNALEKFTKFNNFRIRRQDTPTMVVEKEGEELDVNQLSQGEKSLLALVGDIARRLALLNPSLANPLEGEGVVMIDEVDLHLHPKWQHDLIDKLVATFPNVQFILTTHSPHVISDRPDILVYALDDGELTQVPNVYGEDVNTVLTKVFDVPIRDPKAQKDFDKVAELIYQKKFEEAESYIVKLEKQMPENLELLRCRLYLTQAQLAAKKEG